MIKTYLLAAAVAGAVSMTPMFEAQPAIPADAKQTIEKANADWLTALKKLDDAAVVAPYADDAVFVTGAGAAVRGRDGIAAMMRERFARTGPAIGGTITQDGTAMVGDLIYEWGHAEVVFGAAGGPASKSAGRYLTVWKKDAGDRWRIHRNLSLS